MADIEMAAEMQETQAHELPTRAAATVNDDFWRRDEVVYLLHAWRDVAADRVGSSSTATSSPGTHPEDPVRYQQRIFERFCGFYDDASAASRPPPRSFKSLMKTKKSLLRAYRFIAVFNQNHVIARSMSAMGGRNWFSLPEDEQRRVVAAHYKRKPFAYIDEDMFDAIEMIQEMETQQPDDDDEVSGRYQQQQQQRMPSLRFAHGSSAAVKHEFEGRPDVAPSHRSAMGRFSRAAHPRVERPSRVIAESPRGDSESAVSSSRFGASWTPEDHLALLRAWEECLDEPRNEDEPVAVLDTRVYERFQALSGGGNAQRSQLAVRLKRYSLLSTFEFIRDFDNGVNESRPHGLAWFDTTRKYRNAVVQRHYKKSHFAHIDTDMFAAMARIVAKTKSSEQRRSLGGGGGSLASADAAAMPFAAPVASPRVSPLRTDTLASKREARNTVATDEDNEDDDARAREPWGRHETSLLLSAWSHAETLVQQDAHARDAIGNLDAFIYKRFCTNCGGESLRDSADVLARKRVLEHTFELISTFNRDVSKRRADTGADAPANWFALRKGERNRRIRDAPQQCTDIDEGTFNELRWIFQVRKQAALLSTLSTTPVPTARTGSRPPTPSTHSQQQQEPTGGQGHMRAVTVWSRDEVLHLVQAWTEILDGPCAATESLAALNDRIYARFVELIGGATIRSVKALHAKRDSVVASYHFIQDFNRGKMVAPSGSGVAWRAGDWFALSHDEQKLVVKTFYRKVSFSYLYSDMMAAVAAIIAKTPAVVASSSTVGFAQRKPRPNSWTPDELRSFLRAWYELTREQPREATETATAFNARLHRRFVQLCSGRSKKAEVSLLTKRRVLTTTYEFIVEFNTHTHVDSAGAVVQDDWFRLDDVERRKKMVLVNKNVHTVTHIDEETFFALDRILGGGVDGDGQMLHYHHGMRDGSQLPWSSDVGATADGSGDDVKTGSSLGAGIASATATLYDSVREFIGAKRKALPLAATVSIKRQKMADGLASPRSVGVTSPTATLYDSVRVFIGALRPSSALLSTVAPVVMGRPVRTKIETRARRREVLAASVATATATATTPASRRASSSANSVLDGSRTNQQRVVDVRGGSDSHDLDVIASMLDRQTQHLASIVDEIKAERQIEQEERRQLLDAILEDQREERRLRREEQAHERELARQRWEEFREERRADREQERLVLAQLVSLHTEFAKAHATS